MAEAGEGVGEREMGEMKVFTAVGPFPFHARPKALSRFFFQSEVAAAISGKF